MTSFKKSQMYKIHSTRLPDSDIIQESLGMLSINATASFSEDKNEKQNLNAIFENMHF
jgi:hypothetical protein